MRRNGLLGFRHGGGLFDGFGGGGMGGRGRRGGGRLGVLRFDGLAGQLGLAVIEQRLPREMLYTCDELFFTGTVAEITPIRSVDGQPVGTGVRGPMTARLQQRFHAITHGEIADSRAWLTRV